MPPSTTDVFDVSQGTIITASTPGISPSPSPILGGIAGGNEAATAFAPDIGIGNSSFIEMRTTGRATLNGLRLYAGNDGPNFSFRRAMRAFRLLADADGDGAFETSVVDTAIDANYGSQPGNLATASNSLELNFTFNDITAQDWRVEFEQGTSIGSFEGVRIIEVDGFGTVAGAIVQPASVTTSYRQAFSSGIGQISFTFNQSGLSHPYISSVTNFDSYIATTVHDNNNGAMMLVNSNGLNQPNGVVNLGGTFTLDLGEALPIDALGLWAAQTNEGITAMAVYADTDSNFTNGGALFLGEFNVANTLSGRSFAFPAVQTRFVHIEVLGHSGANFIRHGEFAVRLADAVEHGDMNCDGEINGLDVEAFVLALTDPVGYGSAFPGCDSRNGDFTGNGVIDSDDVQAFVELLIGG